MEDRGPLLWRHVAALSLLLVLVWSQLDLTGVFIADEGSYGTQVLALREGHWDMGYPFRSEDPTGRFVPYHASSVTDRLVVPYAPHPAWPAALHATSSLGHEVGLRVLGVGSLVGLSTVAWSIAENLRDRQAGRWAFWFAAASPALANAWMLWAHAPSALLGGLVVLAGLRAGRARAWIGIGGLASAGGVLLRSEGLLWAGAAGLAMLALGGGRRARICGLTVLGGAASAWVCERLVVTSIVDGGAARGLESRGAGAAIAERLEGVRIAFIDGSVASDLGRTLGVVTIVAMGIAVVLWRRRPDDPAVPLLLASVAGVVTARWVSASRDPVPGLLAAAPCVLLAVAWRPGTADRRWLPVAIALFGVAVAATIYPDGGAFQWGGRFLSPALAPLCAMAGSVVAPALLARERNRQRLLSAALGAVVLSQAVGAVVVPDRLRRLSEAGVERVDATGADVVVAGGTQVARLDWRAWPDRCWIAIPDDAGVAETREVLAVLSRSGVRQAAYAAVDPDVLRRAGAEVEGDGRGPGDVGLLTLADVSGKLEISPPYACAGGAP